MYKQAYSLIREILDDDEFQQYVKDCTGKHLSIISTGVQVNAPAAGIALSSGTYTRKSNTKGEVGYTITFVLPFFGADAFEQCLDFVETFINISFQYKTDNNFILDAVPNIEIDSERNFWTININLTVEVLL